MNDITAKLLLIIYNIFVMHVMATITMILYSLRSNKEEFNLICWFKTNITRFKLGAILLIGLGVLMVIVPDFSSVLGVLGFSAQSSPIGLGLAVGAILIAGVNGNKPTE